MREIESAYDAATYLVSCLGIDGGKLEPFLFLADKYHLMHYSRTITPLSYSFENGLISAVEPIELKYNSTFEYLSLSDQKALDFVVDNFSKFSIEELYAYLKTILNNGIVDINQMFFYPEDIDDPFRKINSKIVALSKELYFDRKQVLDSFSEVLKK